jgi:glycine/D-amino acid oxidase-like deaminating enzyme
MIPLNDGWRHGCCVYCSHPIHVDLVHANEAAWTEAEIRRHVEQDYRRFGATVRVVSVERAREAPDRLGEALPAHGWLVTWEAC